jgi:hypothetical protein
MRNIFTLSLILFTCLLAKAQVSKPIVDNSRILVGIPECISKRVQAGLSQARWSLGKTQIALIAGRDHVSTTYVIYNLAGHTVHHGAFIKEKAGECEYIDLEGNPANYRIVFTGAPSVAHTSQCL